MEFFEVILLIFLLIILLGFILYILNEKRKKNQEKLYQAKYPYKYSCRDGHIVRSLSEVLIDNFLYSHKIPHLTEDTIVKDSDKNFKYDFYLPEIDTYIEFFGYSGKKYYDTKEEKEKFYKKNKLNLITILPQDLGNIAESLRLKLGKYWITKENPKYCPRCGERVDLRIS